MSMRVPSDRLLSNESSEQKGETAMNPIRNSAKAVIIDQERILLTKNADDKGFFYLFPGGGQERGEELRDAVIRECVEEIGCEVEVRDLLFVREYIGKNHEFAEWDSEVHQVEFYFDCSIIRGTDNYQGSNPDADQVGVEWIALDRLNEVRVYPEQFAVYISKGGKMPTYYGDTN